MSEAKESLDYADHVVKTALKGYPEVAADSLLNPLLVGKISSVVSSITRKLNFLFEKTYWLSEEEKEKIRKNAYNVLIEIAINLVGIEKDWVGFSEEETEESLKIIMETLRDWEEIEKAESGEARIAREVVQEKIEDMKKVMASRKGVLGMVSWIGKNIEERVKESKTITVSFLLEIEKEIKSNIYYIMYKNKVCRFGNDYAIGLRWLRRLGYVQVSTNPTLAAIAYEDDPNFWNKFKEEIKKRRELLDDIEKNKDKLTMLATMVALWPNMEVLRPAAYLLNFKDGMVSYQLNPNVAMDFKESVKDAINIYYETQRYFEEYDKYLLWGWPKEVERGRPNIVFKVAGNSKAAVDITRELESMGIGTNNTVTFSVSQEVRLLISKLEGMISAAKKGIKSTKNYETNMGGRLEDHLREVFAEKLVRKALERHEDKIRVLFELARKLGLKVEDPYSTWVGATGWGYNYTAKSLEEKIKLVCFRQYIKKLTEKEFVEFLASNKVVGSSYEETLKFLEEWEKAIGMSGTLVAQRVWWIFFSEENRKKWISYLALKYNIEFEKVEEILNNIDVLPASKRKPEDTLLTLSWKNVTNTEFPDHQLAVQKVSMEKEFNVKNYENSIEKKIDPKIVEMLYEIEDFRKAYEITPELAEILKEVGIDTSNLGNNGLTYEEWPSFGAVEKTMNGFTESYNTFRDKVMKIAKELKEKELT